MALDPHYVDGWVEGCLERIGEDDPEEELLFRELWEDETQREVVIESLRPTVWSGREDLRAFEVVSRRLEASTAYLHNTVTMVDEESVE